MARAVTLNTCVAHSLIPCQNSLWNVPHSVVLYCIVLFTIPQERIVESVHKQTRLDIDVSLKINEKVRSSYARGRSHVSPWLLASNFFRTQYLWGISLFFIYFYELINSTWLYTSAWIPIIKMYPSHESRAIVESRGSPAVPEPRGWSVERFQLIVYVGDP